MIVQGRLAGVRNLNFRAQNLALFFAHPVHTICQEPSSHG
jgi:hypothetical protein